MRSHTPLNIRRAAKRPLATTAAVAALAIGLSACGTSSATPPAATTAPSSAPTTTAPSPGTTTPRSSSGATTAQQTAAYRNCLSQHGVKLPSRPAGGRPAAGGGAGGFAGGGAGGFAGGGGFASNPAFAKASQACAKYRPAGGFGGGFGRGGGVAALANNKAYTNCLKIYGVTLPSRPAAGSATSTTTPSTTTPSTTRPTFSATQRQAFQKCVALLPAGSRNRFGARGSTTTTTTTVAG